MALILLQKAFKVDLTLSELENPFQDSIYAWKGRLLLFNLLSYFYFKTGPEKSLKFIAESQKIATR